MRELDLQALEPRLLLDAAAAVTVVESADVSSDNMQATLSGTEDTPYSLSSLSVTDEGGAEGTDQYTLNLSLDAAAVDAGAVLSSGGSSTAFTGTAQEITDQLAGVTVTPGENYTDDITLNLNLTEGGESRSSLDFVATLTPVNDDPVFTDSGENYPSATEAGTFTFSIEALGLSDPDITSGEQGEDQLILAIDSLPTTGKLTFNGSPVAVGSTFDASQISKLVYTHDGSDIAVGDTDSFSVTVVDGAGGEAFAMLNVELIPDNAAPAVTGDSQQFEGQSTSLGLTYTDEESGHADAAANATVEITNLGNLADRGTLYLDLNEDGIADADEVISSISDDLASFTADQLQYLSFAHDGDEPDFDDRPSFTIKVTDVGGGEGEGNALSSERTITIGILENNDDPTLTPTTEALDATTNADSSVVITTAALGAVDPDSTTDQLAYSVQSIPTYGEIQLNVGTEESPEWVELIVGTSFTQTQVDSGFVRYVQTESAPEGTTTDTGFTFGLVDSEFKAFDTAGDAGTWGGANSPTTGTLTFTVDDGVGGQGLDPQDPIDSISINAGLVVEEATSTTIATVISTSELQYTVTAGAYTYPTSQIVYTVSVLPTNGTLYVDGTALSAYGSFTQADIDAGLVTFLQDGSEDHESEFAYTVTNGGDFTAIDTFSIDATPVNDAPVASDSSVSVIEKTVDGTGIVRITDLVMTDADGSEEGLGDEGATDDLWFQISLDDLSGGTLQVWDGSEWVAASEDVWYSQDILSADADGETSGLRYVHDGGESTDELNDSFTFIVRDDLAAPSDPFDTDTSTPTDNGLETSNVSNTGTVTIAVTPFNDAPMIPLTADAADQTVTNAAGGTTTSANNPLALGEGETAVITNSLLQAVDSDNTTRQSTYVVESLPENGTLLVSGKTLRVGSSFTQADIDSGLLSYEHDGGETRSDDFTFTVSDGPLTTDEATFDIVITPLDDSPEITGTQPEDKLIPASTALSALDLGGAFVIGDVDILDAESGLGVDAAETDSIKVSLSLKDEDGAIVPFTTAVLTALPSGADSTVITDANTLVIEGTLEAVQASLDTLSVQMVLDPISGEEDPDQRWTLEAVVDDRLGDGSLNGGSANEGGAAIGEDFNTVTANVELWASTENDAPVVTLPDTTELVVTEDGGYQDIGTITVTDADSFDEDVTVVLSVPAGNLQITAAGDAVVSGNQSGTITVIGTVTDIKAALENIQYQPDENDNGTVELTVTATDTDLHGDGTAITTTATTDITITAVNDVPLLTVPTETLVMDDGQPLTISGISVADDNDFGQDVYNDVQTVMVTVEQGEAFADGTLDLVAGIGLTVSGQETGVLELTGTLADLNAALATLEFTAADINDDKSAKLNITFNDEGNGDPTQENAQEESASASITINVSGENDAPTITSATPEAGVLNEDSSLNLSALGVVLNDPDDFGADNLTLTLTVQHGTFNDGTSNVTLTGTEAQLQAALNAETYTADGDYYGEDILGITFNDGGNTGLIAGTNESGEQEVSRNITLTVTSVNDRPVSDGADESVVAINEDTADANISGTDLLTLLNDQYSDTTDDQTQENGLTAASEETPLTYVAITGNSSTSNQGTWQVLIGSDWIDIPAGLSDSSALVVSADADIRFVLADDFNGVPGALAVRLGDGSDLGINTSDSASDLFDLADEPNGNLGDQASVWSDALIAIGTSVIETNDAPAIPDDSVTLAAIDEDVTDSEGDTVANLMGGNFDDASADDQTDEAVSGGSEADSFAGVAIISNPSIDTEGTWQYSTDAGATWIDVPDDVSDSNALVLTPTDSLRFVPAENYHGAPTGLDYVVADDSSGAVTSESRVDVSTFDQAGIWSDAASAATLNTTVNPINDAPVLTGSTAPEAFAISVVENSGPGTGSAEVALVSEASLSDIDTALVGDNFGGGTITITIDTATNFDIFSVDEALDGFANADLDDGTLTVALASGTTAAQVAALVNSLTYQNVSDDPDTTTRAYTVVVNDGNNDGLSEDESGGDASLDSNILTGYLKVVDTNDDPVAVNDAGITDEDTALAVDAENGVLSNDTDLDTPEEDFVVSQVNGSDGNVGQLVAGSTGGSFTLNQDGSWSFTPDGDFEGLKAGESAVTTVTYQVSDGEGGVSTATVSVTVNGVDDIPTLIADTGAVTEDTNVTDGDLTTSGTLAAGTDGDTGEDKFTAETLAGIYGELTVDADGNWTYSADNAQDAIQQLNQGATLTDSLTVTNADGVTTTTVDITITGVNDAPVAVADTGTTSENSDLVVAAVDGVLSNDTDIDQGSTKTVSQVAGAGTGVDASVAMTGAGRSPLLPMAVIPSRRVPILTISP